jgi:hypothetical protein
LFGASWGKARGQGHWPIKEKAKPAPLQLKRKTHLFKNQPEKVGHPKKNKSTPSQGVKGAPPAHGQQESLSKKILSEMTYMTGDDCDALPERVLDNNSVRGQAGIDELYRRHHLYLHAHFAWSFGESKAENFRAVFHGLPLGFRNDLMTLFPASNGNSELRRGKLLSCNDKQAVFVENVQLRKNSNVSFFRNVISAVRLTLFDFCQSGIADERLDVFFYPLIKLGFSQVDGKESLISKSGSGSIFQCESVNKMIESGSEVVETIADHQRKRWIEWLALCKPDDNLLPIRLMFEGDRVISARVVPNHHL